MRADSAAARTAVRARARLDLLSDGVTGQQRMLPGYLVVGTKRGGSTSLAGWIAAHPEVGPCRAGKGTHYFDTHHDRGWSWYRAQFPRVSRGFRLTGESSPYYMFHPAAAERIVRELPGVRVLACLRDPVERAWSHHAYETAHGRETETFERALALEEGRLAGQEERLRADPAAPAPHWRYHAYLRRGHYAEQLEPFYRALGPERVLVVQSEELFADPAGEMERVHAFLGLSPHADPSRTALNAGDGAARGGMDAATRRRLEEYFAPHTAALERLTGREFRWGAAAGTASAGS